MTGDSSSSSLDAERAERFSQPKGEGKRTSNVDSLDVLKLELPMTIGPVLELDLTVLLDLLVLGDLLGEFELKAKSDRDTNQLHVLLLPVASKSRENSPLSL